MINSVSTKLLAKLQTVYILTYTICKCLWFALHVMKAVRIMYMYVVIIIIIVIMIIVIIIIITVIIILCTELNWDMFA